MAETQHEQLERIFSEVLALDSSAEQAAALDRLCGSDLQLRERVNALLKAYRAAGNFLDAPLADPDVTLDADAGLEQAGTRVGPYKLLQRIGEGGFGAVYMAEQETPVRRKVALKLIKLGMDTKQVIARFEAERQALALMDHPNIARVLDAGATETGRPYFVMELVKGMPIVEFCDRGRLSTRERLTLFVQVCQAVQHAHQKGIIHRDIKPSNVLVTLHDSTPVPKVIDFGIAKATSQPLTDKTLFTEFRQFLGTPEYMSPDQAEISGLDVDTRTDIYSLGVLLYVLLTGTTPFDGQTLRVAGYDEIRRIIRDVDPERPSARIHTLSRTGAGDMTADRRQIKPAGLFRLLRGELDWIVLKAMEKDRTRRYQTAYELAEDVQRYLRDEPVRASPPGVWYRAMKFVRRNGVAVSAGTCVLLALAGGLVATTRYYLVAAHERDAARAAEGRADAEALRSERIANLLQDLFVSTNPDQALARGVDVEGVLNAARAVFGDDHAAVAATLSSRALQVESAGDLDGAERLYNESLRLWREHFGEDNFNVAATLRTLGQLQATKGDNRGAEQSYRRCIEITRRLPGGPSVTLADTLCQLASVLANGGRYGEAVELLRESVKIRQTVAPTQRLQLASTLDSLANTLMLSGRDDEIETLLPELLAAWRAALPPKGPVIARVLTNIARVYLRRNELDAAEPLLREAIDIFQSPGNTWAQYHALALDAMCQLQERRNEPAAIVPIAEGSLAAAQRAGDDTAIQELRKSLGNFCWYLVRTLKHSRTECETALRGIQACVRVPPEDIRLVNTLGVAQYRVSQYKEALATLRHCDEHNSKTYEFGHPTDTAFLAMIYHRLGLPEEARAALARLRQSMQSAAFANDEDCRAVAGEAEALVGAADGGPSASQP